MLERRPEARLSSVETQKSEMHHKSVFIFFIARQATIKFSAVHGLPNLIKIY